MTCRYDNINQHDALYNAVRSYPGSVETLAVRMGMVPGTLRKKLMPDVDTHHANFEEVSLIIELLEGAKVANAFLPLYAFCWRHNHVAVALPKGDVDADDLLKQVLEIMSGDGALATNISGALRGDHRIDAGELASIEEQIERCIGNLVVLRDKARAKHVADFSATK